MEEIRHEYLAKRISILSLNQKEMIKRCRRLIDNRTVGLILHGKSIEELENRIEEFKDLNICWCSINRFDIIQECILDKIDKKFSIISDLAEVQYVEQYEKQIRIPKWKNFFRTNKKGIIITTNEVIGGLERFNLYREIEYYRGHLFTIEGARELEVPNSVSIFLLILALCHIKKLIIFGLDGFGNPKAFKDTPVWDASEMEMSDEEKNKTLDTYYKPEHLIEQRRIGFNNPNASHLHTNCPSFNDQFVKILNRFCSEYKIKKPEIINCSQNSLHTLFEKITYDELKNNVT